MSRICCGLRAEGRRRQDDDRVQPRGRDRPARRSARSLIDGSLQFGDLRALLRVPVDAPSILDLPTDRIAETDLQDVLWRDPSGIDILLAPPRIEMAEMVTVRDIDKMLSLLRRVYDVVVIDMPGDLNDIDLAFLDLSDTILEIVTYDSTTIHNTIARGRHVPDASATRRRRSATSSTAPTRPGGIDPTDLAAGARAGARAPRRDRTAGSSSRATTRASRSCSPTRRARSARTSCASPASCSAAAPAAAAAGQRGRARRPRCRTRGRSASSTPASAA